MGNIAVVIFLQEGLLVPAAPLIKIDHHKVNLPVVFFIQADGAPSLALGIESTLTVDDDVIGLSRHRALVHVGAGNKWPILTIAGIIQPRINSQIFSGICDGGEGQSAHQQKS